MFADAGIDQPAGHLGRAGRRRQEAHQGRQVRPRASRARNIAENIHHAFVFAKQHGADFFDASGNADLHRRRRGRGASSSTSTSWPRTRSPPRATPSTPRTSRVSDFATGKAAMLLWQAAASNLEVARHEARRRTASPRCPCSPAPRAPGANVNSMVAGINLAVFKNTKNLDGALKFVKFMTSDAGAEDPQHARTARSRRSRRPRATRRSPTRDCRSCAEPRQERGGRCRRSPTESSSRRWSAPR